MRAVKYLGSQLFSTVNILNVGFSFLLTGVNITSSASSPFLFGLLIQGGGEFLGLSFSLRDVVKLYAASLAINKITPMTRKVTMNQVVSRITYNTMFEFEKKMFHKPHSYLIATPLGKKQETIVSARMGTENFLGNLIHVIFPSGLELTAAVFVLSISYEWEIGLWVLSFIVFSTLFNGFTGSYINSTQKAYTEARMTAGRVFAALMTNFESVYYFNTLNYELDKLHRFISATQVADQANIQLPEKISLVHTTVISFSMFWLIVYVGDKLIDEEYTPRDISVITYFLLQIITPLNNLGESISKMRAAHAELDPVLQELETKPTDIDPRVGVELKLDRSAPVEIAFENVFFSYDAKEPLLNGISFVAEAGKTTAIVGLSGGGKSTIGRLLFRLYQPDQGQITFNGIDISTIQLHSLRNHLAIVPQNPVLFNDTLRYNIAYGAFSLGEPFPDDSEIKKIVREADLQALVAKSTEGLDKVIGEGGGMVSGGQLLRIAIARAMIRNAPVVLLDEYTAALDPATEEFIQRSMKEALKGKTKIIIAHRLTTIKDADKIIVLDKGSIAEQGDFQFLMQKEGLFYNFWQKQIGEQQGSESKSGHQHPTHQQGYATDEEEELKKVQIIRKSQSFSYGLPHQYYLAVEETGSLNAKDGKEKPASKGFGRGLYAPLVPKKPVTKKTSKASTPGVQDPNPYSLPVVKPGQNFSS